MKRPESLTVPQSKIEKDPAMLAEQNLLVSENALHRA